MADLLDLIVVNLRARIAEHRPLDFMDELGVVNVLPPLPCDPDALLFILNARTGEYIPVNVAVLEDGWISFHPFGWAVDPCYPRDQILGKPN